jgi:RNA polymerase sigma-70 factor (ECF subfamily)
MAADPQFADLIQRVRAKDSQAAADLVRQFEPEIRRYVRVRLSPARQRGYDSDDVLTSVFGNFFVRVVAGQFELEQPEQLIKLLITMAHNKMIDIAIKPGNRRTRNCDPSVWARFMANGHSPSDVVSKEEILREVHDRLTPDERDLMEQRAQGRSWKDIADSCGVNPDALRKKLERALDRICRELGLDEERHE